jgi:hypothetical protein
MFRSDGVTILEARYVLRTSDGAAVRPTPWPASRAAKSSIPR